MCGEGMQSAPSSSNQPLGTKNRTLAKERCGQKEHSDFTSH